MSADLAGDTWPAWVWPHWLHRQLDPAGPDYTPGVAASRPSDAGPPRRLPDRLRSEPVNTTDRSWTVLGNLSSSARATVDRRGLVTTRPGRWSLDWWIGADDRWHVPSREAAVRQHLVDDMPVVETLMRIPGGDAVHRAHAVRDGALDLVVVEIENRSPVPFAVALAVRPYDAAALGAVERIELDGDRLVASVDGARAVLFAKAPRRVAASTGAAGDVADLVMTGRAEGEHLPADLVCPDRLAQAAFIFPVPHTATVRVALPLAAAGDEPGGGRRRRPAEVARSGGTVDVRSLPDGVRVAAGWRTQGERGVRLELPDARLATLVDRARRHLLLVPGGRDLVSIPAQPVDHVAAVSVLGALDAFGYHDEVDQVLDGWFAGATDGGEGNGATLVALDRHHRMTGRTGSGGRDEELALCIGRAARALDRTYGSRRRPRAVAATPWHDAAWSVAGWRVAADLLDALDQPDAARLVRAATWPEVARSAGTGPVEVADLALVNVDPRPDDWAERVQVVRRLFDVDGAVHDADGPTGLRPAATAMLARAELALGIGPGAEGDAVDEAAAADDEGAGAHGPADRLAWLLDHVSDSGGWPEVVHPRTGRGCAGSGHDPVATAELLALVRDQLVREVADGLALCTVWPAAWLGQGLEVHDAPTVFGRCSFAVRWHGERPALLWDVDGAPAAFRLTVPGLDPAWSATDPKGEALLAAPFANLARDVGGSFA